MCPQERLVIISKQTGLSFVLKRIGPLAAIISLAFYLLVLYLSAISKPPEYLSVSIYSESFIETACQHLLLLVGFDTLIYRKYYDTPPILVGHHGSFSKKNVAPYLLIKVRYMCIVLFPGSLISDTLQNIVIIAIVSNYYIIDPKGKLKPYKLHSHMD